jgi:hypothetical protein
VNAAAKATDVHGAPWFRDAAHTEVELAAGANRPHRHVTPLCQSPSRGSSTLMICRTATAEWRAVEAPGRLTPFSLRQVQLRNASTLPDHSPDDQHRRAGATPIQDRRVIG